MVSLNRNGRYWQARWTDPLTGRLCRRSIGPRSVMTRQQAFAVCSVISEEISQAATLQLNNTSVITLGEWRDQWMAMRTDLLKSSRIVHERYWGMLLNQFGSDRTLVAISKLDAMEARARLEVAADAQHGASSIARSKAESTIARFCRNARMYWRDAIRMEYATDNPWMSTRSTAPEVQIPRRVLSDAEVDSIMDASTKSGVRILIALCYYAGLRKNEALSLRWEHVDFKRNRISVYPPNGRVSTKHRFREVRLDKRLATILTEVLRTSETVCGKVTGARAWIDLKAASIRAGVDGDVSFQLMRSSRENHWMGDYPPNVVTAWLGHSAQVAARHYRGVPDRYYTEDPRDAEIRRLKMQLESMQAQALRNRARNSEDVSLVCPKTGASSSASMRSDPNREVPGNLRIG